MGDNAVPPPRRIAIVYDRQALTGDAASRDVLVQIGAIDAVLRGRGVECARIGLDLDLAAFKETLRTFQPDIVFNLVESLDGSDSLQTLVPLLLENWRLPFTGCGSLAMQLSNDKQLAKARLAAAGLPVPASAWLGAEGELCLSPGGVVDGPQGDYIVKTTDSHASLHLDDASVLRAPDGEILARVLAETSRRHGRTFFAEQFIDGREFNLSLIDLPGESPEILPPAEIRFDNLPSDKPRIVGYDAKWEEESIEYLATPRSFSFPVEDNCLLDELRALAAASWQALGLSGYARVDFRVDESGRPFILEANANPCLSPDAGLAAAAGRAGYDYATLVQKIVAAAGAACLSRKHPRA